jgi:small subunit ribosomal protein S4
LAKPVGLAKPDRGGLILEERNVVRTRYQRHEAKYKIDRRMGCELWGPQPRQPPRICPGQHGQRRKGKLRLWRAIAREQKLRGYYGNISERQFRGIYAEAIRMKGDSGANMIGLLERRSTP